MTYKAKVAVCSEIRTKHSTQSEHHVEFYIVKTWRYVKKPLGFKSLILFKFVLYIVIVVLLVSTCRVGLQNFWVKYFYPLKVMQNRMLRAISPFLLQAIHCQMGHCQSSTHAFMTQIFFVPFVISFILQAPVSPPADRKLVGKKSAKCAARLVSTSVYSFNYWDNSKNYEHLATTGLCRHETKMEDPDLYLKNKQKLGYI